MVTISMDRTMKDLLDRHCNLNQCGRSETVRRAIMRYISPEEREAAPVSEETETDPSSEARVEDSGEPIVKPHEEAAAHKEPVELRDLTEDIKRILRENP